MKSIVELRKQKDELQKAIGAYMHELNNWDTKLQSIEQKEQNSDIYTEKIRQDGYKKGLEDAWELARQVVLDGALGGMSNDNLRTCFGITSEIGILRMDAIEAMQKYEEWKNKKKEKQSIRIGDVITVKGSYEMVVIEVSVYEYDNNSLSYTCVDKKTGTVWHYSEDADIKKTGEHYILPWAKGEAE